MAFVAESVLAVTVNLSSGRPLHVPLSGSKLYTQLFKVVCEQYSGAMDNSLSLVCTDSLRRVQADTPDSFFKAGQVFQVVLVGL